MTATSAEPGRHPHPTSRRCPDLAAAGRGRGDAGAVGLGVRRDPPPRRRLLTRLRCRSAGSSSARSASAVVALGRGLPRPTGRPVGLDRDDRRAVVRRLQRRPQRRRAARRRRHRGDADPGLAGADRAARGDVPRRAVHALPRARPRPGLRRRRPDRDGLRRLQRRPQRARRRAVPGHRGRLLGQPGPAEAAGRRLPADPRHLAGLHGRRGRVPAVRRASWSTTPARPRRPTIWWVVYLGVFPTAIAFTTYAYALRTMSRQQPRRDDLPGPADHDRDGLALPRRDPARDGVRRRRARAGRCGGRPPQAAHAGRRACAALPESCHDLGR